jgi:hypothetical protein
VSLFSLATRVLAVCGHCWLLLYVERMSFLFLNDY